MAYSQEFQQWYQSVKKTADVGQRFKTLFSKARESIARERQLSLEVVVLISLLDQDNGAVNLGFASKADMAKALGLTENMYWKRAQVGRVVEFFPEVWGMLERGETHLSHVALIAPKITEANKDIILPRMKHKSEREVRELLSTVTRDGKILDKEPELELRLKLTKSQVERLDRAKEVLSARGHVPTQEEVLMRAVEDLLEKRDPVRKARRAMQRQQTKKDRADKPSVKKVAGRNDSSHLQQQVVTQTAQADKLDEQSLKNTRYADQSSAQKEIGDKHTNDSSQKDTLAKTSLKKGDSQKSPHEVRPEKESSAQKASRRTIPAAVRHNLMHRSGGQCMYTAPDGARCQARGMLEVDHIHAHSLGGNDDISNLRVLCREHNVSAAIATLGWRHMEGYLKARFRR